MIAFSLFSPFAHLADAIVEFLGLSLDSSVGIALSFFLFELVKVSLLIVAISWIMALIRRALPVDAVRSWLKTPSGRILGYPGSALFGALTPFCSCSSVPLFIGFIEARIPIGIALAFLITSPLVNEIVVALFIASFGWKVALIYMIAGISLGIIGGWVLQKIKAERWLTSFAQRDSLRATSSSCCSTSPSPEQSSVPCCAGANETHSTKPTTSCCDGTTSEPTCCDDSPDDPNPESSCAAKPESAIAFANREARDIYFGVLPYLAIALLIGAGIHGFVPEQAFATWFATGRWWDIPAAVVLGFPLYASASATVPVLETLIAKGVPLGTGMAFIMSAVGVSLPELIILKRVMTIRLMVAFSLTVAIGVGLVGLLFNTLQF